MVYFGDRVRALRLAKGLNQKQLALQLNVTPSVISAYENGFRYPSYDVLIKLAAVFSTTTDYLLGVKHGALLDVSDLSDEDRQMLVALVDRLKRG